MIVNMRGVWGVLSRVGAIVLAFGGTVGAVDSIRCHDSFFTVVVDSELDSRVQAYVEPVRITKERIKNHGHDVIVLRSIGEMWISQAAHGKLSQIYPGYYGESLIEGPKAAIFSTCMDVSNRLTECSEKEAAAGNPEASLDAVRSIELINIVRFGSYETLFTSGAYLRRPTKLLKPNLKKLTPETLARLEKALDPNVRLAKTELLNQVNKRERNQYAIRYGQAQAREDDLSYASFMNKKGRHIAAEHFYGFDREIGIEELKKSH